jgi:hypothetical protein
MKWTDDMPGKVYFVLAAVASLVIAALAGAKWC